MDRTPAREILCRFESIFSSSNDLKEISNIFIERESDFYSFIDLKRELQIFFEEDGLPTELLENSNKWFGFKKLLVKILIDCPLVNGEGRVSRFFFEKGEDEQIRFRVKIKNLGSFKVTLKEKYNI